MSVRTDVLTEGSNLVTGNGTLTIVEFPDIVVWACGIAVLAIVGLVIRQEHALNKITYLRAQIEDAMRVITQIKTMHDHPDDFDFGTKRTNEILTQTLEVVAETSKQNAETSRILKELTHYLKADLESRGVKPIPPIGGGK